LRGEVGRSLRGEGEGGVGEGVGWGVATDGARSCADGGWGGWGVPLLGVGVWVCELGGRAEVAVAVGGGHR
jgi:hypothetical protein